MLLENKNAIIYGGGGSIGGAVARRFGAEGARVFLAGRTASTLERVADAIRGVGGAAEIAVVDALDEAAVDAHADAVAAEAGSIDVSFNLVPFLEKQGTPLVEMDVEDYVRPVATAVRSRFLTARAAARAMRRQGSGVILAFGGEAHPPRGFHLGGLQIAFHAIEAMRRQLATELAGTGIRVVSLRTGGIPETIPPEFEARTRITESIERAALLGRAATLEDVGNVAAFAASDRAATITGSVIDISCGTFLN